MSVQEQLCDIAGIGDIDYTALDEFPERPVIDDYARVIIEFPLESENLDMEFSFDQVEVFEHVGTLPQNYVTIQGRLG